jgi:hypothetical protein
MYAARLGTFHPLPASPSRERRWNGNVPRLDAVDDARLRVVVDVKIEVEVVALELLPVAEGLDARFVFGPPGAFACFGGEARAIL